MGGTRLWLAATIVLSALSVAQGQAQEMPPGFAAFANKVRKPPLIVDEDISQDAAEFFPVGDDPSPYVAVLQRHKFRANKNSDKNGPYIFLSRTVPLTFPLGHKEHRVIIYLDDAGKIKSVQSFLFTHTL